MTVNLLLTETQRQWYVDRPTGGVEFIEDYLLKGKINEDGSPVTLHPTQVKIVNDLWKGKWPVVPAGRGVGKTMIMALIIWAWLYCHKTALIIVNSVKKEQLADNLWPQLKRWMLGSLIQPDLCWEKTKVYIKGRESTHFAVARTGANIEGLQGYHDDYLLILIEEASALNDETFDALLGSLTGRGGGNCFGMFGNPRRISGPFANNIMHPAGRFEVTHIPCIDLDGNIHPNVLPEFVHGMLRKYGEQSNQYKVNVLGILPETDEDSIIPREWVEQAALKEEPEEVKPDKQYRIVWGLDVAASIRGDASALVKRQGPIVLEPPKRKHEPNPMQLVAWVQDEYSKTDRHQRPSRIYVDSIGVGHGVAARLDELGLPCDGVAVSRITSNKKRYRRLRDELWWKMREWFGKKDCYIPDDRDLIEELSSPRYSTKTGVIVVESKDDMRERLPEIGSPDTADALMLTFVDQDDLLPSPYLDDEWERRPPTSRAPGLTWMSQ